MTQNTDGMVRLTFQTTIGEGGLIAFEALVPQSMEGKALQKMIDKLSNAAAREQDKRKLDELKASILHSTRQQAHMEMDLKRVDDMNGLKKPNAGEQQQRKNLLENINVLGRNINDMTMQKVALEVKIGD